MSPMKKGEENQSKISAMVSGVSASGLSQTDLCGCA